jgi:hypothetical protein
MAMELKMNIGLTEIIGLIKGLPYNEKLVVKSQLDKDLTSKISTPDLNLKQLLLSGPVMDDEGYDNYQNLRQQFKTWTKKLFLEFRI